LLLKEKNVRLCTGVITVRMECSGGTFENGDEHSGNIKDGVSFVKLSECQLPKKPMV
jgi:hypothetical protein